MPTFARNIIVTCGTSQLELAPEFENLADKLQRLDEKTQIAEDTLKQIAEGTFSDTEELFQREYGRLSGHGRSWINAFGVGAKLNATTILSAPKSRRWF